jgi:hypothetical protein
MEVVTIVRGCERDAELAPNFDQPLIQKRLIFDAVALDLNIKPIRTKDRSIRTGSLDRPLHLASGRMNSNLSFEASAQSNQSLVVSVEQFFIDPGLVVETFEVGQTHQFQEIEVPGLILGQKGEMVGAFFPFPCPFLEPAPRSHVDFTTNDGFDPMVNGLLIKFDRPEHVPVVCEGDRSHVILLRQGKDIFESDGPIQKAILAMDMKVNEVAVFHYDRTILHFLDTGSISR